MKYKVATPVDASKGIGVGQKRTRWVQIGTGWSDDVGGKITVALSALPFRSEFVYLFPVDKEGEREYD